MFETWISLQLYPAVLVHFYLDLPQFLLLKLTVLNINKSCIRKVFLFRTEYTVLTIYFFSLSTIDGKHFEVKFISELSADNLASDDTVLLRIPKKVNSRLHLPPKVFFREATKSFHNVTYLLQPRSTVTLICSGHCVNYKGTILSCYIFFLLLNDLRLKSKTVAVAYEI